MYKTIIALSTIVGLAASMRESDQQMSGHSVLAADAILAPNYGETYEDTPAPGCPSGRTHCETSNASPLYSDCAEAINSISQCNNGNYAGSGCRNLASHGTCTITVCNEDLPFGLGRMFTEAEIAQGIFRLGFFCQDKGSGRVGGYHTYDHPPDSGCTKDTTGCDSSSETYGNVELIHS